MFRRVLTAAAVASIFAGPASALTDFSFAGSFVDDDDVQFFGFTVGALSSVTFVTFSYAGGTQADGTVAPAGGFDPILAVFDSSGAFIGSNDDGSCSEVGTDPSTLDCYDTFLQLSLAAGDYEVAVSQFDNFALGDKSDGFTYDSDPNSSNFTTTFGCSNLRFCDVNADNRTANWNFDILNVDSAVQRPPNGEIPLPAAAPLLVAGLAGLGWAARRRR